MAIIDKKQAPSENTKISTLDDGPDEIQAAEPSTTVTGDQHDAAMCGDRVKVTIFDQDGDGGQEPAFVGVNGVGYLIKRGEPVFIPVEVLHALENSVQEKLESMPNGETRERKIKRFNFTVHGKA